MLIASPHRYERYVRWLAHENGVDGDRLVAAVEASGVDVASLDMRSIVGGISKPALIVHAADDRTVEARSAEAIANAWSGSRLHMFDGLGHNRISRDANVIDDVVAFVSSYA